MTNSRSSRAFSVLPVALFASAALLACSGCDAPGGGSAASVGPPQDAWFQTNVVESDLPVLVEFGATWCGPCRALEPQLEEVAQTMGERLRVVKIDVDQRPELASHYRVTAVPRLLVLQGGAVVGDRTGGFANVQGLQAWIQETLP